MNWNNLKVFVTGGAGFNGSNLVDALVRLSADATVLDNPSDRLGENLANLLGDMTLIGGDVRNLDTIRKARRSLYASVLNSVRDQDTILKQTLWEPSICSTHRSFDKS